MNTRRWGLTGGCLGGCLPRSPLRLPLGPLPCIPTSPSAPLLRVQEQRRREPWRGLQPGSPSCCGVICLLWRLPSPSCPTFSLFFFILRLLPSCVGGCCFVREAVGVLNALVMISKEMRIMVVWQQQSEVQASASSVSMRPFSSAPAGAGAEGSGEGFCLCKGSLLYWKCSLRRIQVVPNPGAPPE